MEETEYERRLAAYDTELAELREQAKLLEEEVLSLRRKLQDAPKRVRTLEERLLESKGQLAQAVSQNEKLSYTLREAREHIAALREEVDKLTQPPSAYGVVVGRNDDGTVDVLSGGRKMRVALSPEVDLDALERGQEVVLNESLNVVLARGNEVAGEVVTIKDVLEDGTRALIVGRADEERVCELADVLIGEKLRAGDHILMDSRSGLLLEKLPRPEVEELVLEEVPDISYADVGGLDEQIEQIADAVELPVRPSRALRASTGFRRRRASCCTGLPGCGKTLIAKAVANSLAKKVAEVSGDKAARSYFLNIKGPELLNKYVGETERQIRLVFQRAREKSEEGWPVIVFFDEMDSMFRTRGSGISSDMESTIVPQLLAEIDGVESLKNVIVIGASNREDLIDPAILRPGRLDVKIKIERPDVTAAAQIFGRYLTADLPLAEDEVRDLGGGDRAEGRRRDDRAHRRGDVPRRRRQPVPRSHLSERRQRGHVLQGLLVGSDDREHRAPGQEGRDQAVHRRWREGHPHRRPHRVDPPGVQGARGPAEHDEPRRLGEDLGQEGRAHRVHPHARASPTTRTTRAAAPSSGWPRGSTSDAAWQGVARRSGAQ